jgi:hypothetical protein
MNVTKPGIPRAHPKIRPDIIVISPSAVTIGQNEGLGMWMPLPSPLTSITWPFGPSWCHSGSRL